ncbi:hypothetical protein [Streptomyces reniochalinae]|uniref:Sugar kinase n=1 Tax=Streptomyces reniochalinae TaxID=2250578 RepID=A0A367EDP9_9ACTN|nr:hypothetical protein [Streptomyces reniochalinae]RCG16083.1 hypothetical protein DQ392_23180 [Streptomyces reniochalinae]
MPYKDESPRPYEPHARPPHRPRHRVFVLVIVVLLIALPAGYLVQSAFQSRASGKDKERAAAATSLTYGRPPKVSQRIYDVPVPLSATRVAFYETNAWEKSTMWVQFRTSPKRLKEFLDEVGSDTAEPAKPVKLHKGRVAVTDKLATEVGWRFDEPKSHYFSAVHAQPKSKPDLKITVDMTYKKRPRVYIVSSTHF